MKELILNGMPIVESLDDVDLSKIKPGTQVLILENKQLTYSGIPYNNAKITFLTRVLYNTLFMFEGVNVNAEIYEQEKKIKNENGDEDYTYEMGSMEYKAKELTECYLVLDQEKQLKVKIGTFDEYCLDWEEDKGFLEKEGFDIYKKIASDSSIHMDKKITDEMNGRYKMNVYIVVPLQDAYLCYKMYDSLCPQRYQWNRQEKMYIMDKNFTMCVELDCIEKDVFEKIKELDCTRYSYQFNEIRDIYFPAHHYDIKDYIKNPEGLDILCKALQFIYTLSPNMIERYFQPVYTDPEIEFTAYMSSLTQWENDISYRYNREKGGYNCGNPEPLTGDIRKAKAVLSQLRKDTHIDVYTGIPIESETLNYIKEYEDVGGFALRVAGKTNGTRGYVRYYTHIGEIFVEATDNEKKEMLERKEVLEKLTTVPAI